MKLLLLSNSKNPMFMIIPASSLTASFLFTLLDVFVIDKTSGINKYSPYAFLRKFVSGFVPSSDTGTKTVGLEMVLTFVLEVILVGFLFMAFGFGIKSPM